MVNTLQVKLRNAEQQIRAISKGSLADKFMSAQVKKYVYGSDVSLLPVAKPWKNAWRKWPNNLE